MYWVVVVWLYWECEVISFASFINSLNENFSDGQFLQMFEFWNILKLLKLVGEYLFNFCQNEVSRAAVRCDLFFESTHPELDFAEKSTKIGIPIVFKLAHFFNLTVCSYEHLIQIFQVLPIDYHQVFEPNHKVLRLLCYLFLKLKIRTIVFRFRLRIMVTIWYLGVGFQN